jgi:hypothetical protein
VTQVADALASAIALLAVLSAPEAGASFNRLLEVMIEGCAEDQGAKRAVLEMLRTRNDELS